MYRLRSKTISYLRVGYFLHIVTVIELLFSCCLFYFFDISSWLAADSTFLKSITLSLVFGLPLIAQLDIRSRFQNYKLVKDNLHIYGFQTRLVKPFIRSSCQRD